MASKKVNDEIDLLEIILTIWNKKLYILLIVTGSLFYTYFTGPKNYSNQFIISSEIRPISLYDEAKYLEYYSFLNSIKKDYSLNLNVIYNKEDNLDHIPIGNLELNSEFQAISNKINKKFLYDLFIDYLNQKSNKISLFKRFNFLTKEEYSNDLEYDEAISNLANSFTLLNVGTSNVIIKFQTSDLVKLEDFLKFVQKEINQNIQKYLVEMFNNYLDYSDTVDRFILEDIESQLNNISNEVAIRELQKKKSTLLSNRYTKRMKATFESSPIANIDEFYAAKIIIDAGNYDLINSSYNKKFLLVAIISTIIGTFFVLIINSIQKRK